MPSPERAVTALRWCAAIAVRHEPPMGASLPPPSLHLAFVGTLMQTATTVLLAATFLLLRAYGRRRRYFLAWGSGWLALAGALLAVLARFALVADPRPDVPAASVLARLLEGAYLAGKVGWLFALVVGTLLFTSGRRLGRAAWLALGIGVAAAMAIPWLLPGLDAMVVVQAPVISAATLWCAWTLARLPSSRRSRGTLLTGLALAALGGLWLVYLLTFGRWLAGVAPSPALWTFTNLNSFFDLLAEVGLGLGMVVLLLEDARREVHDANSQLGLAYDELRRSAQLDALTGCLNRLAFEQDGGAGWPADYGAVVVLDLDNLKTVNDTLGHAAGDRLLRLFAGTLRQTLRPSDRLYRMGGDEFLIVARQGRAEELALRLEELLGRARVPLESGELTVSGSIPMPVPLAASIGAANYASREEVAAAVKEADRAMYLAKRERKGEGARTRIAEIPSSRGRRG